MMWGCFSSAGIRRTELKGSFLHKTIFSQTRLVLSLSPCKNDVVRIVIDEAQPIKARYRVPDLNQHHSQTKDSVTLSWSSGHYQVLMVTFNSKDKLWFESLQNRPSSLPSGPSSLGADLCLHGFQHVYGLPEHPDRLRLRDTSDGEPYRLYNLDVFAADLYCRLGLYGSVPLLVAHKPDRTVGVFWLNASDTFVNTPPVKRRRLRPQTDVRWLSESGVIDCMILLGPRPQQLFKQYAQLTGYQALPPLFSLGYHQCRWNYNDEADVKAVDAEFDRHKIPYDVIWLDIEHTDGKRYFTWDPALFPKPACLQHHLEKKKRKMVVISDPHIKVDPDWSLYREARDGGHFVKDREGQIYRGTCWPGDSSYLDFSRPATRAWYSRCFSLDKYKVRIRSTTCMILLSVVYFVCRAVWTGDNIASWEYLKISIPMVLSLSLAGIAFCGADVGGFVKDPDPELLVRWYQAAALQPFFRGHSAKDTKRREPWLFGEEVTAAIRTLKLTIIKDMLTCECAGFLSCFLFPRYAESILVFSPGAEAISAPFEVLEARCMLTLNNLNLRVGMDWEIRIN
uniref:Glucosidase alpha, neutral C n=1 Tax=Fundulus heteroclitus TaxID=8078 RepID=A0A3Q2QIP7_FUNHE